MDTRGFAGKPGWFRVGEETVISEGMACPEPPPVGSDTDAWFAYLGVLSCMNAQQTNAILQELREQVQKGVVYADTINVATLVPIERVFEPALFSISLTNDGPGNVQYRIPNRGDAVWVTLFPNEVVIFNAIKGVYISAAFRVLAAAANVRIVGVY